MGGGWTVCSRRVAASEVVAGKRLWFLVLGGKVGVRKEVKLPSTSHPCPQGPANLPSSPCWRNRVLALPQSHLRKEKEPGPGATALSKLPGCG